MIKVNKITVAIDEDEARITLYKTNTKLAEFSNYEIDVPSYDISGAQNKTVYQAYCKDVVINLLQNGGIDGYYYEEKQKSETNPVGIKYGTSGFVTAARERLTVIMSEICEQIGTTYTIRDMDDTKITERYKGDNNVKYGTTIFDVTVSNSAHKVNIQIMCEIRSGQMCKPKKFEYKGVEQTLNATNIKRLLNN